MIVTLDLTLNEMNDINDCIGKAIKQYKTKDSDRTAEDEFKLNELISLRKRLFGFDIDRNRIHVAV